jgi:hypothetical protein
MPWFRDQGVIKRPLAENHEIQGVASVLKWISKKD